MGNKNSHKEYPHTFFKEDIFTTNKELIDFVESEILYQLFPEYKCRDFIPRERTFSIIDKAGFEKKIGESEYENQFENPDLVHFSYQGTLIRDKSVNLQFSLKYPSNIKMSMSDFEGWDNKKNDFMDKTIIKFEEKIISDIISYQNS